MNTFQVGDELYYGQGTTSYFVVTKVLPEDKIEIDAYEGDLPVRKVKGAWAISRFILKSKAKKKIVRKLPDWF